MTLRIVQNPRADRKARFGPDQAAAVDPSGARQARDDIAGWPSYRQTPLTPLPELAGRLGIAALWVKDEGQRAPLKSFKAIGAPYALGEALRDLAERRTGSRPAYDALWQRRLAEEFAGLTAVAASDGNHGRALAWAAQAFGLRCRIYLPHGVSAAREEAIREFGAVIERVNGNYEDALAAAKSLCADDDHILIQDTSIDGHELACRRIMQAYTAMTEEIRAALRHALPTHVFIQVGCGGLAAAVIAHWWLERDPACLIGVEPAGADCLLRSLAAGAPVIVEGDHETIMIGMAVGEISALAWPLLDKGMDFTMTLDDEAARHAMRVAARPAQDETIEMGETGAAGLASVIALAQDREAAERVGLGSESRVLVINTEGAIDARSYAEVLAAEA